MCQMDDRTREVWGGIVFPTDCYVCVCVCVYGKGRARGMKDRYFRWGCVTKDRAERLGREKKGPKNIYI